jgi:hypothetical protein
MCLWQRANAHCGELQLRKCMMAASAWRSRQSTQPAGNIATTCNSKHQHCGAVRSAQHAA